MNLRLNIIKNKKANSFELAFLVTYYFSFLLRLNKAKAKDEININSPITW